MKLKVKIMGVPSRQENIDKLVDDLGLSSSDVVYGDESLHRPYETSKTAFTTKLGRGTTHILVIQDDVEVCENFIENVTKIIEVFPNRILTFFNPTYSQYKGFNYYVVDTGTRMFGQAICMPVDLAKQCFNWCDDTLPEMLKIDDDLNIKRFAEANKIKIIGTVVPLVQHLVNEFPSVMNNHFAVFWKSRLYDRSLPNKIDWTTNNLDIKSFIRSKFNK